MTPPSKTRTPSGPPLFFQLQVRRLRASNREVFALVFEIALRVTTPSVMRNGSPREKVGASTPTR
jgi:hypothetical protein